MSGFVVVFSFYILTAASPYRLLQSLQQPCCHLQPSSFPSPCRKVKVFYEYQSSMTYQFVVSLTTSPYIKAGQNDQAVICVLMPLFSVTWIVSGSVSTDGVPSFFKVHIFPQWTTDTFCGSLLTIFQILFLLVLPITSEDYKHLYFTI